MTLVQSAQPPFYGLSLEALGPKRANWLSQGGDQQSGRWATVGVKAELPRIKNSWAPRGVVRVATVSATTSITNHLTSIPAVP